MKIYYFLSFLIATSLMKSAFGFTVDNTVFEQPETGVHDSQGGGSTTKREVAIPTLTGECEDENTSISLEQLKKIIPGFDNYLQKVSDGNTASISIPPMVKVKDKPHCTPSIEFSSEGNFIYVRAIIPEAPAVPGASPNTTLAKAADRFEECYPKDDLKNITLTKDKSDKIVFQDKRKVKDHIDNSQKYEYSAGRMTPHAIPLTETHFNRKKPIEIFFKEPNKGFQGFACHRYQRLFKEDNYLLSPNDIEKEKFIDICNNGSLDNVVKAIGQLKGKKGDLQWIAETMIKATTKKLPDELKKSSDRITTMLEGLKKLDPLVNYDAIQRLGKELQEVIDEVSPLTDFIAARMDEIRGEVPTASSAKKIELATELKELSEILAKFNEKIKELSPVEKFAKANSEAAISLRRLQLQTGVYGALSHSTFKKFDVKHPEKADRLLAEWYDKTNPGKRYLEDEDKWQRPIKHEMKLAEEKIDTLELSIDPLKRLKGKIERQAKAMDRTVTAMDKRFASLQKKLAEDCSYGFWGAQKSPSGCKNGYKAMEDASKMREEILKRQRQKYREGAEKYSYLMQLRSIGKRQLSYMDEDEDEDEDPFMAALRGNKKSGLDSNGIFPGEFDPSSYDPYAKGYHIERDPRSGGANFNGNNPYPFFGMRAG
jgi:predicted  nucleic acid-binding Zn-ribbon protein